MTVQELIDALKGYPRDAAVFVYNEIEDDATEIESVTAGEHAPNEEVYIEIYRETPGPGAKGPRRAARGRS